MANFQDRISDLGALPCLENPDSEKILKKSAGLLTAAEASPCL
jgi:hypothetical protein